MSRRLTKEQQAALRQYLDLFREHRAEVERTSAPMLRRRKGLELMCNALDGADGAKPYPNERFLYTDIATALAPDYGINLHRRSLCPDNARLFRCAVKGMQATTIYVYGDAVQPTDQANANVPEGVYLGSISAYPNPDELRASFADEAWEPDAADPSSWVNSLLASDGVCIVIPDGVKMPVPIQIVNIAEMPLDMMSNRRICIFMGRGAEADVVVCDHAGGNNRQLTTCDVSLQLSEGSRLGYFSIEQTNDKTSRLCNIRAMQHSGSHLTYNGTTLQCGTTRTTLTIVQQERNAVAEVCGAVVADDAERADNYVRIVHGGEDNRSDLLFKYVLGGKAVGAFTGEVYVAEGARRIASEQQSQNLLTTQEARVYSRPVLEIYADDVKCNHGATVGKLDETALFYMQQRGIAEPDARLLLQHAFVNDVLQRISIPALRERLSTLVERRFRNGRAQCDGCRMAEICNDN